MKGQVAVVCEERLSVAAGLPALKGRTMRPEGFYSYFANIILTSSISHTHHPNRNIPSHLTPILSLSHPSLFSLLYPFPSSCILG